jgi:L-lactate dehydrogenase
MKLRDFCAARQTEYDSKAMEEIFRKTRDAAYDIIQRKGATYYAVAAGITRLTEAILRNQNTVLSVSSLVQDFYGISDVCLSLPTVVNCSGIAEVLRIQLDASEIDQLRRSADVLKRAIAALDLSQ